MRSGPSHEALGLRGGLQQVITLVCPRNESLTTLQFQDWTMLGIVNTHRRERGSDPLRQIIVDRTTGGKAAVAVAGTVPEDSYLAFLELTFLPQGGEGMFADGARVVLA